MHLHLTVMRLLLLAAMLGLGACASAKARKPRADCTYLVKTTLTERANEKCHAKPLRPHKGQPPVKPTDKLAGCGGDGKITSNGTRSNVGHENGHIIEELCPEWAKGYFN